MEKNWKISPAKLIWLVIFTIAMANLEAVVVVYLRELYYPEGFHILGFESLKHIPMKILFIEITREAATMFMLAGIAVFSCRKKDWWGWLAVFMISFGIWDIFYYIWLKIFINWPESLLTEDVLFLIPFPWLGPVISPVLVSIVMIISGIYIIIRVKENPPLKKIPFLYGICAVWLIFSSFTLVNLGRDVNLWNNLVVGLFLGVITLITIFSK